MLPCGQRQKLSFIQSGISLRKLETANQPTAFYGIDALQAISGWLLDLHELSTTVEFDAFPRKAIDSLKQFIPHQSSFWGGGHIASDEPVLHYLYLNEVDPVTFVAWKAHKNEVAGTTRLLAENAGRAFTFSAARTPDDPLFRLIFGLDGIRDILSIYLSDEQRGLYHIISLYRNDGIAFSESERGLLQAVARHLIKALRNCHIAHINRLHKSPLVSLTANAIVDMEGILHFAEDRMVASLRTEWPDWHGPWLPHEAWDWLSRVHASRRQFIGRSIVLSLEGNETLRLLSVRPKLALDQLSAREREVARLFASGLKHKEIALHLNVAPSTIRCQLNTVYTKLGINDKGALAEYLSQF